MSTERRGGSRRTNRPQGPAQRQQRPQRPRGAAATRRPAPSRGSEPEHDVHVADGVRLQKVLAQAGLGSRRKCEELIAAGHVEVDGVLVTELGVRVDPAKAVVHVDGMRVQLDASKITIALNKPLGVVSTMSDPEGRPTLADLVKDRSERLFHVGRLDVDSEGLLLLTNDGELANRLAHPRYEIRKTYLVTVAGGEFYPRHGKQLTDGVELEDGLARADKVRVVDAVPGATMLEVVLHEGRNRIVRRMLDAVGFPVTRLVRTRIGPIALGDLRVGRSRVLGRTELGTLMRDVDM
ncbi:pseudouridine synthase [Krasilnikoviella flava]|uniref:Pseudouridine synthase n=1 Tax=Krasilnikoviella flava TaxID=526729 RepID=A0A1T5L414_9MICO|nr:pseudouridine synthase [Krasilnikoviella flava]SKC70782.1 23S rRNA pseudouridine2605 synthase [Krasilnikoviella flava]